MSYAIAHANARSFVSQIKELFSLKRDSSLSFKKKHLPPLSYIFLKKKHISLKIINRETLFMFLVFPGCEA
jgi:hypothetical protein